MTIREWCWHCFVVAIACVLSEKLAGDRSSVTFYGYLAFSLAEYAACVFFVVESTEMRRRD